MDTTKPSQDSTPTESDVHSYSFVVPKRLGNFLAKKCILIAEQTNTEIKIRIEGTKSQKFSRRQQVPGGNLKAKCQIWGPTLKNILQAKHEITTTLYFAKTKVELAEVQPIPSTLCCSAAEQNNTRPNYSAEEKLKNMANCSSNKPAEPSNIQRMKKNQKKQGMKENREANPKKPQTAKLVVPLPGKIKIEKTRNFPNKSSRVNHLSDLEIRKFCRKNEVTLKVRKDQNKWLLRKELKSTFRTTMDNFVSCHRCLREYSTHSGLLSHLRNKGCVARCINSPVKLRAENQVFLYSCYSCSLHFTDLRTYKAHVEDCGCTFFCLDCEKSLENFADFLIHRAVTHRRQELRPHRYDCCSRVFLTFTKMKQHKSNCQSTNSFAPQYVPMPEMLDRDFVKLETNVLSVVQTENTIVLGPPGITKIDIEKQKQKNQEPPTSLTYYTNDRQTRKPLTIQKRKRTNQKQKPSTNQKQRAPLQIMEHPRKEAVISNVIISGIVEKENESFQDLYSATEELFGKLGTPNMDFSQVRRLGRKIEGRSRPVQVKLVRQKDKYLLFKKKQDMKNDDTLKNIFINPEKTRLERFQEQAFRSAVNSWKTSNPSLRYQIRNGVMTVTQNGAKKLCRVDDGGTVYEDVI